MNEGKHKGGRNPLFSFICKFYPSKRLLCSPSQPRTCPREQDPSERLSRYYKAGTQYSVSILQEQGGWSAGRRWAAGIYRLKERVTRPCMLLNTLVDSHKQSASDESSKTGPLKVDDNYNIFQPCWFFSEKKHLQHKKSFKSPKGVINGKAPW